MVKKMKGGIKMMNKNIDGLSKMKPSEVRNTKKRKRRENKKHPYKKTRKNIFKLNTQEVKNEKEK